MLNRMIFRKVGQGFNDIGCAGESAHLFKRKLAEVARVYLLLLLLLELLLKGMGFLLMAGLVLVVGHELW